MHHIEISVDERLGAGSFFDIQKGLEAMSLSMNIKEHSIREPFASLEWVIPTGIVLVILKPYYETFLVKAAEDHYEMMKSFIKSKLYKKAIQPDSEYKIVNIDGVEKETIFTMHFSVMHKITKGDKSISLRLMFPKKCSSEYFEKAISKFMLFQSELEDKHQVDLWFDKLVKADGGMLGVKVFWYNESKSSLEFLDLIQSARTKSIVAKEGL